MSIPNSVGAHFFLNIGLAQVWNKVKVLVSQLCPTLCNPMEFSPPGSSVHGILQVRILEWVAIPFSRGPSWPRDQTQVSCIAGRFFMVWEAWTQGNWDQILKNEMIK